MCHFRAADVLYSTKFLFLSDYLTSELQAGRMIGGEEDLMEIEDQVSLHVTCA